MPAPMGAPTFYLDFDGDGGHRGYAPPPTMTCGEEGRRQRLGSRRWPAPLAASGAATAAAVHTAFVARAAAGDQAAAGFPPPDPSSLASMFHSSRSSSVGLSDYLAQVLSGVCCSSASLVLSVLLLDRAADALPPLALRMESSSACLLALTAVVLATKVHDDIYYSNSFYASVGGVSTAELKQLELAFLASVRFCLHVTPEQYMKMETDLLVAAAANPVVAALAAAHGYATGLRAQLEPPPLALLEEAEAGGGGLGEYVCQDRCGGCVDCSDLKFSIVPPVQLLQSYLLGDLVPPRPPYVERPPSYERHPAGVGMRPPLSAPTPPPSAPSVAVDLWSGGGSVGKSMVDGSDGSYGAPYMSYSSFSSSAFGPPSLVATSAGVAAAPCWGRAPYSLPVGSYADVDGSRGPPHSTVYGPSFGRHLGSGMEDSGGAQRGAMDVTDAGRSNGSRFTYDGVHMMLSGNEYEKQRLRREQEQWPQQQQQQQQEQQHQQLQQQQQQQQQLDHAHHVQQVQDSQQYEQQFHLQQQQQREQQKAEELRPLSGDAHPAALQYPGGVGSQRRSSGADSNQRFHAATQARLLADQHLLFCGRDGVVADAAQAPHAPRAGVKGGDAAWFSRYGAEEPLFSGGVGASQGVAAAPGYGRGGGDAVGTWGATDRQCARSVVGGAPPGGVELGASTAPLQERSFDLWSYGTDRVGDGYGYSAGPATAPPMRSGATFWPNEAVNCGHVLCG